MNIPLYPLGAMLLLSLFGTFVVDRRGGVATAQSIEDQFLPTLECFNTTDLAVLAACIGNDTLAALGCNSTITGSFEDTVNCVNDTINGLVVDVITALPDCVGLTINTLGQCALDNREDCSISCTTVGFDDNEDDIVDWTSLLTCNQIQQSVLNPLCIPIVSCCPTCVTAFEEFSECLINDLIPMVSQPFQQCDFECTTAVGGERQRRRRELLLSSTTTGTHEDKRVRRSERSLLFSSSTTSATAMSTIVTTATSSSTGFPDRSILDCGNKDLIDRPNTLETVGGALGCVTEEFLEIIQQRVALDDEDTPTASPVDSSAAATFHDSMNLILTPTMSGIVLFSMLLTF